MAKKTQIFKSFAELAADMMQQVAKQADDIVKTKRPRITVTKSSADGAQKIEYTPSRKFTSDEIRIYNAWNKYKSTEPYASMPEDEAYKAFIDDWNFRHDPSRTAVRDLGQSINQMDRTTGTTTPS